VRRKRLVIGQELVRGVDPKVGVMAREFFDLAISPGDGAGGDAGAAASFHVGGGVAYKQAILGADAEGFERFE
jgi:hypothetical protein